MDDWSLIKIEREVEVDGETADGIGLKLKLKFQLVTTMLQIDSQNGVPVASKIDFKPVECIND